MIKAHVAYAKRAVLWSFILFCVFPLSARKIEFTVTDVDIEIPLEGVVLEVQASGEKWETDFDGHVTAEIPDELIEAGAILTAKLPGYPEKTIKLDKDAVFVEIGLSMLFDDVLEGKELVVEQKAYQATDAESGISVVVTKDQIDGAVQIGAIPDVMTAVKTLPGVTYSGQFSQQPSIRGGYPYEMASILDGMYVSNPFHWAGSVSIFDPLFVSSVKLSHGVFSARYGHATSGLLDVTTVTPDDTPRFDASVSSVQTDGVLQLPIGKGFSLVGGYRVTYYDTWPWILDKLHITPFLVKLNTNDFDSQDFFLTDYIKKFPYMHDFYLKALYKPFDRLSFQVAGFYGEEGILVQYSTDYAPEETETIGKDYYSYRWTKDTTVAKFEWKNIFSFASLKAKWLPTDKLQFEVSAGYNNYDSGLFIDFDSDNRYKSITYNKRNKNPEVEVEPEPEIVEPDNTVQPEITGYATYVEVNPNKTLPEDEEKLDPAKIDPKDLSTYESKTLMNLDFESSYFISLYQAKINADYLINQNNIVSVGVEELFKTKSTTNLWKWKYYNYVIDTDAGKDPTEKLDDEYEVPFDFSIKGNNMLNSVGYATWEFGNETSKLQGEFGLRVEHYLLYNPKTELNQNMVPTFNPRVYARYNVFKDKSFIDSLNVSAGAGLFSLLSDSTLNLLDIYKIEGDKLKPDMNFFGIAGVQMDFLKDYSFQLEGYYKYYFNRYYASGILNTYSSILSYFLEKNKGFLNKAFCDGKGFATGFDMMLQKKTGRYFDGYLTYSFIVARYLNPYKPADENTLTDVTQEPMGEWYYPYFHRFHSLMGVLNWRPSNGLTFTLSGGIVGGVPIKKNSLLSELMGSNNNTQVRSSMSFPVNFRIGYADFFKTTKCKIEWYFAIENALGFLSRSSVLGAINYMSTHVNEDNIYMYADTIANFDIGIPILSLGFRLSY